MEKLLVLTFCALGLISFTFGRTDNVVDEVFHIAMVYKNIEESNEQGAFRTMLLFQSINDGWKFEPKGSLLKKSPKCLGDILHAFKNRRYPWAMKLFDSFGKPESGIFEGNTHWLGDYNECLGVTSTNPYSSTIGNFRGKYCIASLEVQIEKMRSIWKSVFKVSLETHSASLQQTNIPLFSCAICVPDSCSAEELKEDVLQLLHLSGALPRLNGIVFNNESFTPTVTLECKPTGRRLHNLTIVIIVLWSLCVILTLTGSSITILQYFHTIIQGYKITSDKQSSDRKQLIADQKESLVNAQHNNKLLQDDRKGMMEKLEAFLNCFCVFKNASKILNTNESEGEILCLHGLRFLSFCWVVLGHTALIGIIQTKNILSLLEYTDIFVFQIIERAFYSTDTFFVMSGFLVAHLSKKEFAKSNRQISWMYICIHRYVRFTFVYMMILAFYSTVYLHFGSGPYWTDEDKEPKCKRNWWKNLLYINNFDDISEQCMAWAWFMAINMQFFLISPLFVITLWRCPKIGYTLLAVVMLACWLSNFFITYHFELKADAINFAQVATTSLAKNKDYWNKIYHMPYTRISPFLIGIVTAHLLNKKKERKYRRHSLVFMCLGWVFSTIIGLTCVCFLYHRNLSLVGSSFYNAFHCTGFSLSVAWVIYACLVEPDGAVNRFLSFKFFIPLSRVTYAAYLIHPMIIRGIFFSMKASVELNPEIFLCLYFGIVVMIYAAAIPVSLMLESPVIALEMWVVNNIIKRKKYQK